MSKIQICQSVSWIADPNAQKFAGICCINPDGNLNRVKVEAFIAKSKTMGVTVYRLFPFLLDEGGAVNPCYMPHVFRDWEYDLTQFNPTYWKNLSWLSFVCCCNGIWLYPVLFDNCHGNWKNSPWILNHQGVNTWYDNSPVAVEMRRLYTLQVYQAMSAYVTPGAGTIPVTCPKTGQKCTGGLTESNTGETVPLDFSICLLNEPVDSRAAQVAVQAMQLLEQFPRKVPHQRVDFGNRYAGPPKWEPEGYVYNTINIALRSAGFNDKENYICRIIHGVDENFLSMYPHILNGGSRFRLSGDGQARKWTAAEWEKYLTPFFLKCRTGRSFNDVNGFIFEVETADVNNDAPAGIMRAFQTWQKQ